MEQNSGYTVTKNKGDTLKFQNGVEMRGKMVEEREKRIKNRII